MKRSHPIISLFIVLVLGLHLPPVVIGSSEHKWPFLAYAMYRFSRPPGPIRTVKLSVIGVTTQGERLEIDTTEIVPRYFNLFRQQADGEPDVVGVNNYVLRQRYLRPMWKGDAEAAKQLARQINAGRTDPIVAFHLESEPYVISDTGIVREDKQVIVYSLNN